MNLWMPEAVEPTDTGLFLGSKENHRMHIILIFCLEGGGSCHEQVLVSKVA